MGRALCALAHFRTRTRVATGIFLLWNSRPVSELCGRSHGHNADITGHRRMNSKSTWIWIVIAAGLAAFMWVSTQMQQPPPAPPPIVPKQLAASVTSVNVHPSASSEIRAELTNGSWHLAAPISTPAQGAAIQTLLAKLAQLAPARYLTAGELRDQPNATEEYGLVEPQFSVTLQQADARRQLRFGIRTAPGDQVFLQVVGIEGVYVVDAEILKWLPHTAADWRDPGFVDLRNLPFDRLDLTNGATAIELQVDPAEHTWRMTRPLRVRADSRRINELLVALQRLRVTQFVTDEPKAERERFGLQPAELTLALSRGTNPVRTLLFGKSPTNDATQVFACREDFPSIVTVAREAIEPWRALPNAFRDHQLISVKPGVEEIEFKNGASFTLRHAGTNAWSIAGEKFPVDAKLAGELVQLLDQITILQFRKDIVTEPDLPDLGLATPALQITFRSPTTNGADAKPLETRLAFSAPQGDTVNVRRSDEDAVYAVALSDFLQLPTATWQLRERRIWNFS
ncbi:MAG: DUF4340 domain-containing protein, partial [Verrucomicrobia bacterium]